MPYKLFPPKILLEELLVKEDLVEQEERDEGEDEPYGPGKDAVGGLRHGVKHVAIDHDYDLFN